VLLLPENLDWQDEGRLEYLFFHEYVHIRRLDILKKYLLTAVLCLHWFNPLVWVMFIVFNRDMELACDEAVLRQGGFESRKDYALLLINFQEQRSRSPFGSHFSKNAVEERIVAIMKSGKSKPIFQLLSVILVVCALLCFTTSTQAQKVSTEVGQQNARVWPTESHVISVAFGEHTHPITGQTMFIDRIYIAGERGDAVFSAVDGIVSQAGFDTKYGNYVVVSGGNGVKILCGQLEKVLAAEGDGIRAGEQIGTLGTTGTVTGPCLSFGVFVDGQPVNPVSYFE
jgi:murein DD-endopeptidase MepM/ murein hydrolase activator NlpD